ncbi:DUF2103 domain-containing protein [Haloarchaeobius salinus]|uniref:DUF2103 domain-containing protein n=1 Tax=Haloarchaeobius salinus TaxID=1198298 RepID=UPI002109133D|nr:DUF2103 domain-containing protein [Haloarchaeobius salinus]
MDCRRCETSLERPGDYCLTCHTANCDAVVLDCARERATVTVLDGEEVVGETTVTTVPDDGQETGVVEFRNFAGRVADEIRRKRPETVYAAGDRSVVRETRAQLHHEFYRVDDEDPVAAAIGGLGESGLDVVDLAPREKIGGAHSTLIGGRTGQTAIRTVAEHPHVKKVIPGPIEAGGSSSQASVGAKVTRADGNGNVRMLIRDGSSVQENRVVTTAGDREMGERVREDLNEALTTADLG